MKKRILGIISLLMATMLLFGCGSKPTSDNAENTESADQKQEQSSDHYPITIPTYNYSKEAVEMTFEKAPERVIAIYQSPIETMLALGLEDRIALAVMLDDPVKDEYKAAFDKIQYREDLPSKEEIIAMEPDMILSWYSLFSEKDYGDIGFWNENGTKTYIWQNAGLKKPNTLENEYQDILNIGKIFDVEEKAQEIVNSMKSDIENTKKQVEGKEKIRAIIVEVEKDGQYRVYGQDTIGGDIATQVGAELVGADLSSIGKEQLIELNPDVIFSVYYGDAIIRDQSTAAITQDDALKSVSAVENDRVHSIVLSEVYASGIRTHDGIKTIISGLYPELAN